jgi:hypothetical protein
MQSFVRLFYVASVVAPCAASAHSNNTARAAAAADPAAATLPTATLRPSSGAYVFER